MHYTGGIFVELILYSHTNIVEVFMLCATILLFCEMVPESSVCIAHANHGRMLIHQVTVMVSSFLSLLHCPLDISVEVDHHLQLPLMSAHTPKHMALHVEYLLLPLLPPHPHREGEAFEMTYDPPPSPLPPPLQKYLLGMC